MSSLAEPILPPEDTASAGPHSLAGATRREIAAAILEAGVPERELRMRTAQLWHWIYHAGVTSFDRMGNVSKALRAALAERFTLNRPEIVAEQLSKDGTRKWLLRLDRQSFEDKAAEIECVYIPESDRGTLCVS